MNLLHEVARNRLLANIARSPPLCNPMTTPSPILEARALGRTYATASGPLTVLQDVTFALGAGSTAAIVGPSGSGKTTLLGLCAGLDRASCGEIFLEGQPLHEMSEDARARLRNERVGFVFQNFQLMPTLTALENVLLPLELRGGKFDRKAGMDLLERVGLKGRLNHYPVQLSGGEQQRVALARAFIGRPAILFADEPTGNLDAETGAAIEEMLFALNREAGTTLVMVTHDSELAQRAGRVLRMKGGRLVAAEEPVFA
jgi:putative ABC transport system ATP-binding protein